MLNKADLTERLADAESRIKKLQKVEVEVVNTENSPHTPEVRKTKRLNILAWALGGILFLILVSIVVTAYFGFASIEISTELIVINAILGSSLTTIIGVIAGTSID